MKVRVQIQRPARFRILLLRFRILLSMKNSVIMQKLSCWGEDEGEGPYTARIFRARIKILCVLRSLRGDHAHAATP
jgi:hypothetical protein